MDVRKVVCTDGSGKISVCDEKCPEPSCGEILIEVKASLVSPGTELGEVQRRRANPDSSIPAQAFGYSNAGVVIKQGEGCEDIPLGARIACMGGGYAQHATYACIPRNLCVPIPDSLSFEEGSFVHLGATALQAIRRSRLEIGEHYLVVGLGIIGQICCQLARIGGAHVIGWDRTPLRLDIAKRCGAGEVVDNSNGENAVKSTIEFAGGYGIDCGIIAFGGDAQDAFDMIKQTLKKTLDGHRMGRIVNVGGATVKFASASALGNVDIMSSARTGPGYLDDAYEHGRDYPPVFVRWTTKRNMEEILRWAEEGALQLNELITHRVPIDEAPEACELLIRSPDKALGVVFNP